MVLVGAAQLDAGARALQKPPLFSAFSYVCPEPVLVSGSFFNRKSGSKIDVFRTTEKTVSAF
jgi:hypothetical protein